jgi:hypothetical protein
MDAETLFYLDTKQIEKMLKDRIIRDLAKIDL